MKIIEVTIALALSLLGFHSYSSPNIGVQHASTSLVEGAKMAKAQGFRHINIWISPNRSNYPDSNLGPAQNLVERIQTDPYQEVLKMGFENIVLTTYTNATWNWIMSGSDTISQSLLDAESEEIRNLVVYLADNFPDQNFQIKNWEGDWHLTGDIHSPMRQISVERLETWKSWFQARSDGVSQAREIATNGATRIKFGIEFQLTSRIPAGLFNVLEHIVPHVPADFVSYSSWEGLTLDPKKIQKDIHTTIDRIRKYTELPLTISEFGFSNFKSSASFTSLALKQFRREKILDVYYWEMTGEDWGLIKPDGSINPALRVLRKEISKISKQH